MSGAFIKNPQRRRAREAEVRSKHEIGPTPAEFLIPFPEIGYQKAAKLKKLWDDFLAEALEGELRSNHHTALKNLCLAQYQIEHGGNNTPAMHAIVNKYLGQLYLRPDVVPDGAGGRKPKQNEKQNRFSKYA